MNDDKLKSLFKSDDYIPEKPIGEWNQIVQKVEKKQVSSLKLLIPSFAILVLVIIGSLKGVSFYQEQQDKELVEFLLESDDLNEDEDQYLITYF